MDTKRTFVHRSLIASTSWHEIVKLDETVDREMVELLLQGNGNDDDGRSILRRLRRPSSKREYHLTESKKKAAAKTKDFARHAVGLQSWRRLVRMMNVLVSPDGVGFPAVASNLNRYSRVDVYEFFKRFGMEPGYNPLPEWRDMDDGTLYTAIAAVISYICGRAVTCETAKAVLVRSVGTSYYFDNEAAAKMGLPCHASFCLAKI